MTTPSSSGDIRQHLRRLADNLVDAAADLADIAAHPEATLVARGYHRDPDFIAWYQTTKQDAAQAAVGYAQHLRAQADSCPDDALPDTLRHAGTITQIARVGGITIDSSHMPGSDPHHSRLQQELAAAGHLRLVAEPGQVPFYRLVTPDQASVERAADATDGW